MQTIHEKMDIYRGKNSHTQGYTLSGSLSKCIKFKCLFLWRHYKN